MTRLTTEDRKAVIERFYARVAEGVPIDEQWKRGMMAASTPRLPDQPTPAQLDAWIELAEIVQDEGFVAAMKANAAETWGPGFDLAAHQRASAEAAVAARTMLDRGVAPEADEAAPIVERLLVGLAAALGKPVDAEFRAATHARYTGQDPRAARYWVLVAILAGRESPANEEWKWLIAAMAHHLAPR